MSLGLSFDELTKLATFGNSPEKLNEAIFEKSDNKYISSHEMMLSITAFLFTHSIDLIMANNERITQQLKDAGIKLPD